jgi:hypothetical protein
VTSARFFPFTCTGSVMASSTSSARSTVGHGAGGDEAFAAERLPALFGEVGPSWAEKLGEDACRLGKRAATSADTGPGASPSAAWRALASS